MRTRKWKYLNVSIFKKFKKENQVCSSKTVFLNNLELQKVEPEIFFLKT